MATLYIETPTKTKREILQFIDSESEQEICTGIFQAVVQQTEGSNYVDVAHHVVRAASLNRKSKEIKKIFFYFIETFPKFDSEGNLVQEALVFCNYLRQQIEHPNEFVRGRAINLLSKLKSPEIFELLYKPLKENLYHPNSYVRRNVYLAIGVIYSEYRFEEIPQLIYDCFATETDAKNLKQLFSILSSIDTSLAERYLNSCDVEEIPSEMLVSILFQYKNHDFSMHCLFPKNKAVRFQATVNLLESFLYSQQEHKQTLIKQSEVQESIKLYVDNIMEIIKEEEESEMRDFSLSLFNQLYLNEIFSFKNYSIEILCLCKVSDNDLIKSIFNFAFEISEPHEFMQISNFVTNFFKETSALNEQKKLQKIIVMEMMTKIVEIYGMYEEEMLKEILPCLEDEDPEIQFGGFQFISAISEISREKAFNIALNSLKTIKLGKIFRTALSLIKKCCNKNNIKIMLEHLDDILMTKNLPCKAESSNVNFVSIIVTEAVLKNIKDIQRDTIGKSISILFRLSKHEIDLCTRTTINSCIRLILKRNTIAIDNKPSLAKGEEVTAPLSFNLIPIKNKIPSFASEKDFEKVDVVQLTSLSDPIYCEANVQNLEESLLVDMLCINQTSFDLHNVLFDFIFSKNLALNTPISPFQMSPNSIKEVKFNFKIKEAMNGFVLGRITFGYPDERKKFSQTEVSVNLGEIKVCVLDFLKPYKVDSETFRREWLKFEWENVYSLKFNTKECLNGISKIVIKCLNGFIVDEEYTEDFYLANVSCVTQQGSDVLINIGIRKSTVIHFNARIRSRDEELVKSLGSAIGETLKDLKI